jgi:hypothetical protein
VRGVCRLNPYTGSCRFCTMFYRSGRNAAERMYRKLRSRHLVQAFASRHSLRRDVSTAMIYNPKDRSIPLPSLRRGGRRHRACLNVCKTVGSIMRAYHGVDGGCSRCESRAGGGFTSHSGRFATAGRESDYGASPERPRGSGRPRRGAPRPNRPHVTRTTSGSRRVTFAPQLVHYPPDKLPQYTTPKQEPLETVLHETTEFPPGMRHQVQQHLPAWEEIGAVR